MAKLNGIIKIIGSFNGVNYCYRNGKLVTRKAGGGFNREAIKSSPKMKVVRQNNSEFGRVSTNKKHFKKALEPILIGINHPDVHRSLMSLFQKIKNCDIQSERGGRNIFKGLESEEGQRLLENFHFFPGCPLPGKTIRNMQLEKISGKLNIEGFSPPTRARRNYLLQGCCLHFDFETNAYKLKRSEALIFEKKELPTNLKFILPPQPGDNIWLLHYREIHEEPDSGKEKAGGFGLSVVGWLRKE